RAVPTAAPPPEAAPPTPAPAPAVGRVDAPHREGVPVPAPTVAARHEPSPSGPLPGGGGLLEINLAPQADAPPDVIEEETTHPPGSEVARLPGEVLPLLGGLLPLNLRDWQQGVRELIRRLDGLAKEPSVPVWSCLAPWCAVLG